MGSQQQAPGRPGRPGPRPGPRLVREVDAQIFQEFCVTESQVGLGSAEHNDLILTDLAVSPQHARLYWDGTRCLLADLNGSTGTWVNDVRLKGRRQLLHGDRFRVGSAEFVFEWPEAMDASAADVLAAGPGPGQPQSGSRDAPSPEEALEPLPDVRPRGGVRVRPTLSGIVLVLVVVATAIYWLASLAATDGAGQAVASPPAVAVRLAEPTQPEVSPSQAPGSTERPVSMDDRLAEAASLVNSSQFEAAVALYQDLARRFPEVAGPQIGWAWALLLDDLPDQALVHAQRAFQLDQSAEAAAVLARSYLEIGGRERSALTIAQRAVDLDPNSARAQSVLAEALLLNHQTTEAAAAAELALQNDPDSAEAHRVLGLLFQLVDHDLEGAAREFRRAAELQPGLWLRQHELGSLLLEAGDDEGAVAALLKALGLRHKLATHAALGQAYFSLGQYSRALSYLEWAASGGASDATTLAYLAAVYARNGQCAAAAAYAGQALALDPEHPSALEAERACSESRAQAAPEPPPGQAGKLPPPAALTGWIAFPVMNVETGKVDTHMARPDGSERALLAEGMHQPAFRPDGRWLALNGDRHEQLDLFVVRQDGKELQAITAYTEDAFPAWSPDGKSLVFSSTRHSDRRSRLFVVDRIPYGEGRVAGRVLLSPWGEVFGERPAWTPDGRIVFSGCDWSLGSERCGLFAIPAVPGSQIPTQITTHAGDTAPSAHGDRVVFMSDRDGNWEIYAVDVDGSSPSRLTDNAAADGLPVWSPDGKAIAFLSNAEGTWAVWAMDANGANRRKLFEIGGGGLDVDWLQQRIAWGPQQ